MKSVKSLVWLALLVVTVPDQLGGQTNDMVPVEYSIRTPIPRRNLKLPISGREYYVSVHGDDQNPGTKEKPFRHIQNCADIMQPGDICLVREGTYRESVRPKNGGRTGDPIPA